MNDKNSAALSAHRVGFWRLLPAITVVLVAALSIPFASNFYVGVAGSGVCSIFIIATAKKKIPALLLLLLLFGVFGLPNGLPLITLILALVVGTGTFSWLIAYSGSPYLAIIPVLAYSATAIISKNWFGSLLALIFALPALALAHSLTAKSNRMGAICLTSGAFIITLVAAIFFSMLYFNGEIRFDVLREYSRNFTDTLKNTFMSYEVELISGAKEPLFSDVEAYNMASRIVTLFPAIAVLFFNVITFFAQHLQFTLVKATLPEDTITVKMAVFILSPGAGIVYLLSFLVSSMVDSSHLGNTVSTVCQNVFMILTPALFIMGIMYFFAKAATKRIRALPLVIIGVVVLAFFNVSVALLLISCFGAYASVAIPLTAYLREKADKE